MPTHATARLNIHVRPGSSQIGWALMLYSTNSQGVPEGHLADYGSFEASELDLVGIEAVAQALALAVNRMA